MILLLILVKRGTYRVYIKFLRFLWCEIKSYFYSIFIKMDGHHYKLHDFIEYEEDVLYCEKCGIYTITGSYTDEFNSDIIWKKKDIEKLKELVIINKIKKIEQKQFINKLR
jgi:hypothetical protein